MKQEIKTETTNLGGEPKNLVANPQTQAAKPTNLGGEPINSGNGTHEPKLGLNPWTCDSLGEGFVFPLFLTFSSDSLDKGFVSSISLFFI